MYLLPPVAYIEILMSTLYYPLLPVSLYKKTNLPYIIYNINYLIKILAFFTYVIYYIKYLIKFLTL